LQEISDRTTAFAARLAAIVIATRGAPFGEPHFLLKVNPMRKIEFARALLATSALLGASASAVAQTDGWYIGAEAGLVVVPTIKFNHLANSWQQTHENGYVGIGQVGYGFGNVRLEGEFSYRHSDLDRFTDPLGSRSAGGSIGGGAVMANAYYDFTTASKLTPYLGVGIGGLDLSAKRITAAGVGVLDNDQTKFAYQGIAGVSYDVSDTMAVKADYRYIRSEKASMTVEPSYGGGNASGTYEAHSFLIGLTFKFPPAAAPAPPPPMQASAPMPPPPPPARIVPPKPVAPAVIEKNYMLFFDFDESVLTEDAKAIVNQAADNARKNHTVTINLTGYTDLSGSEAYNLKLSVRRGESVKKQLIALGIPKEEITVVGKGKSDPLVPTKDGVREAQNRRVVINLQ
jgi:outer membrane protein OmpA-like peptidoglycan-associated protein